MQDACGCVAPAPTLTQRLFVGPNHRREGDVAFLLASRAKDLFFRNRGLREAVWCVDGSRICGIGSVCACHASHHRGTHDVTSWRWHVDGVAQRGSHAAGGFCPLRPHPDVHQPWYQLPVPAGHLDPRGLSVQCAHVLVELWDILGGLGCRRLLSRRREAGRCLEQLRGGSCPAAAGAS